MRYIILSISFLLSLVLIYSCGTESTPVYTLSTSVVGEGSITPPGGEYEEGETVTITASPNEHWLFSNWSGDGSGSSTTVTITMDGNKNVVGNFERRDYPLTITVEGEGTVTEEIVTSKTTEYPYETIVELTPNPKDGWRFVEWSGDLSGNVKPIQITISEEKNVTVKFSPIVYLGENGITIMCPDGEVGDIGVVDGVEYEVVDRNLLDQRIEEGSDLTKVCVSLVKNMSWMFLKHSFNQPIGNWDVSNVIDMSVMFRESQFNQPIGNWDVSNVKNMSNMFFRSQFNQPIGDWDVSNVTNMGSMFGISDFNQPIGDWDVSKVTNMGGMFGSGRSSFNQPIGNWDVSNVTNMGYMFQGSSFNQTIGDWNVSNVRIMESMFHQSIFNQPIGNWNVSMVINMTGMFYQSEFNQPINSWCVTQITTEPHLFSDLSPLTEQNKPIWGTCPN
ncbi:MAG: BspA family leucine-rich repeat surface protein [Candidatus Paceibacterota bacterium]